MEPAPAGDQIKKAATGTFVIFMARSDSLLMCHLNLSSLLTTLRFTCDDERPTHGRRVFEHDPPGRVPTGAPTIGCGLMRGDDQPRR
ncbi:MAG: hypothetical protein OEU90_13690, partial [Gammaproteobacteria bacterium]|nr:hypothetical protein [Gammaproteobacteria bacterium]